MEGRQEVLNRNASRALPTRRQSWWNVCLMEGVLPKAPFVQAQGHQGLGDSPSPSSQLGLCSL